MFEERRQPAQHLTEIALLTEGVGREIVRFIDDEQIPGQLRLATLQMACILEISENVGLLEIVITRDDTRATAPGIGVHAHLALQKNGCVAVYNVKGERELLPHLVAPLHAERCRCHDQHAPYAAAQQELA